MNSKMAPLSHLYAVAFVEVFKDRIDETVFRALLSAQPVLLEHADLLPFLELFGLSEEQRHQMIGMLLKKLALPDFFGKLLELLISKRRIVLLPDVVQAISWSYQESLNRPLFTITSSHELSQQELQQLVDFLAHETGGSIMYNYETDPGLIAGIKAVSNVASWQHSVRRQLQLFQAQYYRLRS